MDNEITEITLAPLGTPPDNEIWYRTDNNRKIAFHYDNFYGVNVRDNKKVGDYWVCTLFRKCERVRRCKTNFEHLTEISFPNSAILDDNLLYLLPKLTSVEIHNDEFESTPLRDGVVHTEWSKDSRGNKVKTGKVFIWCSPSVLTNGGLEYVTLVRNHQFTETDITSLIIPKNISDIGIRAFYKCEKLNALVIIGCNAIYPEAFMYCSKLRTLQLSGDLKRIMYDAFWGCSFSSIRIPSSIEIIDAYAFKDNKNLSIVFFDKLKHESTTTYRFSPDMFDGCNNLRTVVVDNDDVDIIFKDFNLDKINFDIVNKICYVDENGNMVSDK